MKICYDCKQAKPYTEFREEPRNTSDGLTSYCRSCIRARNREQKRKQRAYEGPEVTRAKWNTWYANNREYRLDYIESSERVGASTKVSNAVLAGKIVRSNVCENCGSEDSIQAHHNDYSKPLEVQWLCIECHNLLHMLARAL